MNISKLTPYLLTHFKTEHQLVQEINNMSLNFTQQRDKIEDYLNDEKMVSAYTLFYLTTNYPKLSKILDEHFSNYINEFSDCEWIDIGCGPGTFTFALVDYFKNKIDSTVWGIETSPLMRKQARKIQEGIYPEANIKIVQSVSDISVKTKKRILLFGHSANEMKVNEVQKYIDRLEANFVLFIEPGTKGYFQNFLQIRKELIKKNYNILYPCLSQKSCPMENTEDWCHQYLKVSHDQEVERLTQLTHKNRKWLPLSISLFGLNKKIIYDLNTARIIRTFPSTKFSFEWDVCLYNDDKNRLIHFQVLKRNLSKSEAKELDNILAGRSFTFDVDKDLGDNNLRVLFKGLLK